MHRRLRASARLRPALLAALFSGLIVASPALGTPFNSDINDFNLTESVSRYGGIPGNQYHVSTGNDYVWYRWVDSPSKATVVSVNDCVDGTVLGAPQSYGAGDTGYRTVWGSASSGYCFVIQGRTQSGQGSMSLYDGRIQR